MVPPEAGIKAKNEDDQLAERSKSGDQTAFDRLYDKYKNRIFNYINRMIGDRSTAEELTQETFIKAYVSLSHYKARGYFKTWIYTIASNLAKNELKRRSYKTDVSLSKPIHDSGGDIMLEDVLTDEKLSSESIVENLELKQEIERVIKSLSPKHREVIILCSIDGLSYEEAAYVLKTNINTISSRLARARKRFIEKMKSIRRADAR